MNQLNLIFTFIYLLILSACRCDIQIRHLNENSYQDAHVIKAYKNMGLKMCGRRCLHQKLCSAINYNPVQLYCELLHETEKDRKISSVPDFKYSTIDKWSSSNDPCYPNPCPGYERCVKTQIDGYYCQNVAPRPQDCTDLQTVGVPSGVYTIYINGGMNVSVYCDMVIDNGGWLVFQNRYDGSIEFQVNRTWSDYRNGFGLYSSEYWLDKGEGFVPLKHENPLQLFAPVLSLEYIYLLTRFDMYMLRVDLETSVGVSRYATYTTFKLSNETDQYRLTINGYKGTAALGRYPTNGLPVPKGDLEGKTGMMFTNGHTFRSPGDYHDYEDDIFYYKYGYGQTGGWWYNRYTKVYLNGNYMPGVKDWTSMIWYGYQNTTVGMKTTSMKIKRK